MRTDVEYFDKNIHISVVFFFFSQAIRLYLRLPVASRQAASCPSLQIARHTNKTTRDDTFSHLMSLRHIAVMATACCCWSLASSFSKRMTFCCTKKKNNQNSIKSIQSIKSIYPVFHAVVTHPVRPKKDIVHLRSLSSRSASASSSSSS